MARFSDGLIEKIKQQSDLLDLIKKQGYEPKKHGARDYVIACPFHEDKTPSCVITPKENLFHCFGCGEAGSVIDWVMKTQGVSFRHAVEILQQDNPSLAAKPVKHGTTPKLAGVISADAGQQKLLHQITAYYHQCLLDSPEALEYLAKRGLNHPELIKTFLLGYANRTLGYRLPQKNRAEGKAIREQLQTVGILRQSGHEHFTGSVVFPVVSPGGEIQEIYGRKLLGNRLRKGTPIHTYLPGEHGGVWNVACLAASEEIILCESLIDAMTFWVNGFKNVTSSYGTNGFTDEHLSAFRQHQIKRVLIAYDNDEAGNTATEKLTETLTAEGMDCFRIEVPKGMDINEYALAVQPAAKSLGLVIRQAVWLGNGVKPDITTHAENEPAELAGIGSIDGALVDTDTGEVITEKAPPEATATVMPESPETLNFRTQGDDLLVALDNLTWRIRGLEKNTNPEQLKINLLVKNDNGFHVDNLDLYASRARQAYGKQAGTELCISEQTIKQHLGTLLLQLEMKQDKMLNAKRQQTEQGKVMSESDREAAVALLKSPDLLQRILNDLDTCGVVGEETNKLTGYLAATSRKLDKPLAVMIQSSSAAGKSSLMDAILQLFPDEQQIKYSAMTGQSLFYMGETNLKHKILAIAEEEGAENASYALKLLQSEGEVSIASTGKNPTTGNLETQQYKVEGPVMLMMTTTAIDIDEELLNRCLVLTVNESREQTEEIHRKQRQSQTLEGLLQQQNKKDLVTLHQNAQRLLRPLLVANPYAEKLTFLSDKTRTRRDHMKYLTLIRSITLLHQFQREIKRVEHGGQSVEYIEVTLEDIATANRLAHEVLGRSLDELPPQTRKLLVLIMEMVKSICEAQQLNPKQYHFTRKDIRQFTGWSDNQLKVHCVRLVEMEYLIAHGGGRGALIRYELLYDGNPEDDRQYMPGLIDEDTLCNDYDEQKLECSGQKLGSGWGDVGGKLEGSCIVASQEQKTIQPDLPEITEDHVSGDALSSHRSHAAPLAANASLVASARS